MITIEHPTFTAESDDWEKFRLTYDGGRAFIRKYLKKYSLREDISDFNDRKDITYCPCFAGAAIDEIKNSIFSRLPDVVRINDSETYKNAILGNLQGVNYTGSSIDSFIGCGVLPELLVMRKVGVFVDMPTNVPTTLNKQKDIHPYFYIYRAEDIKSWTYGEPGSGQEFVKLLLHDNYYVKDSDFGLISGKSDQFRLLEWTPDGILVTFMNSSGEILRKTVLNLPKIPFVLFEIQHSLMKNVADYQIALLNLESTDIEYARKANFPVYTEQSSYISTLPNFKPPEQDVLNTITGEMEPSPTPGNETETVKLGTKQGRRYFKGMDRPGFISPSSEPLKVAMDKENNIKRDIRLLVHLATASLGNKSISVESKQFDNQGLESGLSLIALVLEEGERKLATFWNNYENNFKAVPVISYPRHFDLRTDVERRNEAKELSNLLHSIPSSTFKREMLKKIVTILMGGQTEVDTIESMRKEIDNADSVTSDPQTIINDLEAGLVTTETASRVRGYPQGEVEKAKQEHADRLKRINEAQGGIGGSARGIQDTQIDQPTSIIEKKGKPGRGKGKS